MQESVPCVSVIVPVYNVERFLDQALNSIRTQTLSDLEIICVNDGSTDGSVEILERHAREDSRVRIVNKPNGGYGSACNRGIDEAHGTWITIVEPDDWIDPAMYRDMVEFVSTFDVDVDIVKTPYWRVLEPDTPNEHLFNCSYKGRIRPSHQPFTLADRGTEHLLIHHPSIWSALYRTDFMREKNIRFFEIPGAGWADNPFLVETLCQADAIVYLDHAYYYYREETEEKTASFAKSSKTIPFERWHDMVDVLERLNVTTESVWNVQYRRGFTYLDYIVNEIDSDDPQMRDIMARMFARMDDELVLKEPHISPAWKARYLETKGLPARRISPLPYVLTLAGAGVYSIKNVGPAEAIRLVGSVARHDKTARTMETTTQDSASAEDMADPHPMDTTLSIIIPVYNAQRYLEECLLSLAAQTYGEFEVICIDDGSTDGSAALLAEWASRDSRIRVITQKNSGPSSARNAGIQAATGDYVCFLDADDLFEKTACQHILETAESLACDCIVYGWSCFPAEEANAWLLERANVSDAYYPQFDMALLFDEMTNPFLRVAVRRELLVESGLRFDEQLRVGEDAAFLFGLFPRTHSTKLTSRKLYRYRMPHEGSITSISRDGTAEKCVDDLGMMVSIFEDWDRLGILKRHAAKLVHWFIFFYLYTVLRQPAEIRDPLVKAAQELFLAHFTREELYSMPLPPHDALLMRVILGAREDGLGISKRELSKTLLQWRLAEYGALDLARTVTDRLRPR